MQTCPECGSESIYHSSNDENICNACGFVLEDNLIEKDPFVMDSKSHALPNHAGGMGIDGKIVKNSWLYSTREKNIYNAKKQIEEIALKLKIPEYVIEDAKLMVETAMKHNLTLGRDNASFGYACLYASCIIYGLPKTPLEITAFTDMSIHRMLYAYKILSRKLNFKKSYYDPIDLVPRFGSKLGFKPKTISLASEVIMKLKKTAFISGKQPSTIVASSLYLAGKMNGENITQRMVANATGVIECTIRRRCREMLKELNMSR